MKKNVFALFLLNLIASPVQAVEVGDIMYHDRTFTATYIGASSAKMPIGLVYWTYPSKDHGYVMALNQPVDDTWAQASDYCQNFTTLNTKVGDWRLPDLQELIPMGKQSWNKIGDDKFNVLNKKLATITGVGEALKTGNYHSHTTGNAGVLVNLSTGAIINGNSTNKDTQHFRCIMQF